MPDRRWFEAVVFGLAAHRATRLVTADTITEAIRDRIVARAYGDPTVAGQEPLSAEEPDRPWTPEGGWSLYAEHDPNAPLLATLVTCRWCASVHLTAWLLLMAYIAPKSARVLRYILAGSSVAVLLARIEGD